MSRIIEGLVDFILYWRTLPWDHAPGALLAEEAGCTVRRPDGSPYEPGAPGPGLLVAGDERSWLLAVDILDEGPARVGTRTLP